MFDVIIIGAGVIGTATARELSRYDLKICILEKANDVACGTSKANSGIVHSGYDAKPGSLKAKYNILGNKMFDKLSRDLDFPFRRNGALVLAFDSDESKTLETLLERGKQNGVEHLSILSKQQVLDMEPNISDEAIAALYSPSSGIVGPYEMNIAFAENAAANGVEFIFEKTVVKIADKNGVFNIECADGSTYTAKAVVNAAGIYADDINNMVCREKIKITARRGEYCLYDKTSGSIAKATIFQAPGKMGKGILVTPTTHGNLLIGPNADDIDQKDANETTFSGLGGVFEKARRTIPSLSKREIITQFAGLRAHCENDDFIVGESKTKGFFNAAGIESPGLTASPAIGIAVSKMVAKRLKAVKKTNFISKRKNISGFANLSRKQQQAEIKKNPLYGRIICRCEEITEGEIMDAVRRTPGAKDLDGVKRRTRAGMGRCQSGFCSPRVLEIIARELNIPLTEVTKSGGKTNILIAQNKELPQ